MQRDINLDLFSPPSFEGRGMVEIKLILIFFLTFLIEFLIFFKIMYHH